MKILDPIDLISAYRIDLMAKIIYAKFHKYNIKSHWAKELYLNHIAVWNGFKEAYPKKDCLEDFIKHYNNLLNDHATSNWKPNESPVSISNGILNNGGHRTAAAIVYQNKIEVIENDEPGCTNANWEFFKYRKLYVNSGLKQIYLDSMAIEYIKYKKNTYTVSLYSHDLVHIYAVQNLLQKFSKIIIRKLVQLNKKGSLNYIYKLYKNEEWATPFSNNSNLNFKTEMCLPNGKLCFYVIECDSIDELLKFKETIRSLLKRDKHSIHINDTYEETVDISTTILNENSLYHLNNSSPIYPTNFDTLFNKYAAYIRQSNLNTDDFCITSSSVLSAFNLRDCNDIDYISKIDYDFPSQIILHITNIINIMA
jgi:hypothetical protein